MRAAAALLAAVVLAPAAGAQPGPVAAGRWHGVPWTLSAVRDARGRVCTTFTARPRGLPARLPGASVSSCSFSVRPRSPHWLAFAATRSSTRGSLAVPDLLDGVAAPGVARVEVELRGRPPVRARIVRVLGARLFLALLPKDGDVIAVAARDRGGTVLERRRVRLDAPHGFGAGAELIAGG